MPACFKSRSAPPMYPDQCLRAIAIAERHGLASLPAFPIARDRSSMIIMWWSDVGKTGLHLHVAATSVLRRLRRPAGAWRISGAVLCTDSRNGECAKTLAAERRSPSKCVVPEVAKACLSATRRVEVGTQHGGVAPDIMVIARHLDASIHALPGLAGIAAGRDRNDVACVRDPCRHAASMLTGRTPERKARSARRLSGWHARRYRDQLGLSRRFWK